jgi:hypothetical protein
VRCGGSCGDVVTVPGEPGVVVRAACAVTSVDGDRVSFIRTFTCTAWQRPRHSRSTLRFLDLATLGAFLADADLMIEEQFGDWDSAPLTPTSPEIITVARRPAAR